MNTKTFLKCCLFLGLLICSNRLQAQVPSASVTNLDGETISTTQLTKSGHPVVVSFFATWCKPCLRELTAIHEAYEDWQEEIDFELVAVSIDEGVNQFKVKPLVNANDWPFTVWIDSNKQFANALNVTTIPAVVVFDSNGKITYRHTGYIDGAEQELFEHLKSLKP